MKDFTLQLHLTDNCTHACDHCYLKGEESPDKLSTENVYGIIRNFNRMLFKLSELSGEWIKPVVHLTGGDPLLRKDIFDIIRYIKNYNMHVGLLGNPDTVTDDVAKTLSELGINSYQFSLDGRKDFHDRFRNRTGSFDSTKEAIKRLHDHGITRTFLMCNITKENFDEVGDVYRIARSLDAFAFVSARVCSAGGGVDVDNHIRATDYRDLLSRLNSISNEDSTSRTRIVSKDPLWSLYAHEIGEDVVSDMVDGGCQAGISMLNVDSNGDLYACRRMPIKIGTKLDEFFDVYVNNELMNNLRDFNKFEKCNSCDIINNCRGCPAVTYGETGNPFGADPQCWK